MGHPVYYKNKKIKANVPALLTTTRNSLGNSKEIIDLYRYLGVEQIYLRSMGHIGRATNENNKPNEYSFDEFKKHYSQALEYFKELQEKEKL